MTPPKNLANPHFYVTRVSKKTRNISGFAINYFYASIRVILSRGYEDKNRVFLHLRYAKMARFKNLRR
jgi:hypothetical protein